jgi:hopene-associated glycosyltransferase HpnB
LTIYLLAAAPLLIWVYLLTARGGFWRVARSLAPLAANTRVAKTVVAVVPARDEAAVIGDAVRSLLQQDYAGAIHVIVIDDGSSDGTAAAALSAATGLGYARRLSVISAAPPPPGWSGKVWAMSQGVTAAMPLYPDYLLFTDADIHHDADNVAALVTHAEAQGRDMVSCMVRLPTECLAEKALIPAFVFFFFKLYPPAWIASARCRSAGAAGGCMLVRPRALERIGGLRVIRAQIIDDCALARAIKGGGGSIWLGLTLRARSTRRYGSFADIGRMISRTAFNQLRHSYLLLGTTMAALLLTYVLPPLLLLSARPVAMALGGAAWMLMAIVYAPMLRFYGRSPLWSLCLPAIALFYAAATMRSARHYRLGRGGQWKGRAQDLHISIEEPHA